MSLLHIIERIVPIDSDEWDRVAEEHADHFPGREVVSLQRKLAQLYRRKAPSGDPTIPEEIKLAKEIKDFGTL